jgi:hypothetical protein
MVDTGKKVTICVLLTALCGLTSPRHLVATDQTNNPHSDLIFRATGASSCKDCHGLDKTGALIPRPLENDFVIKLRGKAKGIHGPGRFADCLRCHAGGRKDVEQYSR